MEKVRKVEPNKTQLPNRCYDCKYFKYAFWGGGKCTLYNIEIEQYEKCDKCYAKIVKGE